MNGKMISEHFTDREPSNEERADRILEVLEAYLLKHTKEDYDPENAKCELAFLLADVLHFCDSNDLDFKDVMVLAECHHEEEQEY